MQLLNLISSSHTFAVIDNSEKQLICENLFYNILLRNYWRTNVSKYQLLSIPTAIYCINSKIIRKCQQLSALAVKYYQISEIISNYGSLSTFYDNISFAQ